MMNTTSVADDGQIEMAKLFCESIAFTILN
jgi:hypothetical protein